MHKQSHIALLFLFAALGLAFGAGESGAQEATMTSKAVPKMSSGAAPRPFPSFEAKRIAAPKAGSPPRITVQIQEQTPAVAHKPAATAPGMAEADALAVGRYGWFWERVPIAQEATTGAHRLEEALLALRTASSPVAAPRLQMMQEIIQQQAVTILMSSAGTRVSPALVLAVIAVESAGHSDAVSSAGATGLMQLMPDTAARFGVSDALVAEQNIAGGIKYLDWLMEKFGDDAVLALAGYNAGEGAVRDHQGVPPFAETRDYVPKVLAAYQVARGLCMTPPELITDGCVFRQLK